MGAEKAWTGDLRRRVGAPVRRFYICAEAGAPAPLMPPGLPPAEREAMLLDTVQQTNSPPLPALP
jgi:hypothetical protein